MQIRRIAIHDFRKIAKREIADLADGLNVIVGDNEAGKSTMLAALRAAFFERHRVGGAVAEAMLPYGSAVRPTVAVDFELDGKAWSLAKSFVQRPEASLLGPGERHVGDAVEDRLAELFGFTPPGRGGSDPKQHHGTHGLLWVEQGIRSNLGVGAGRDTLAGALEREVGQVTGGERGRALLAAAEERRERFWDKRDRPRGAVLEARRQLDRLEGEQAALRLRQREMEERLTRLDAVGARLDRHRRDDHLGRAIAAAAVAEATLQDVARRTGLRDAALAALREAERIAREAGLGLEQRRTSVARREGLWRDADRAGAAADEAKLLARHRAAAAAETEARLVAARATAEALETALRRAEAATQRRTAEAALAESRAMFQVADEQATRRRDALARAAAIRVDADAVARLTTLERMADRARAELDAASLTITFEPDAATAIVVDGCPHDPTLPLALSRDATLDLGGFGRLHIQPGGGTADLLRKVEAADKALRDALAAVGAGTLSDARRMLDARTRDQGDAAALSRTLAVLAPKGLEGLRQTIEDAAARLTGGPGLDAVAPDADAMIRMRQACEQARGTICGLERDAKAAAVLRQSTATEAATLVERRNNARRQFEAATDELATARHAVDDDLLASRAATAGSGLEQAEGQAAQAGRDLAAADAETAQLALDRARLAEREIRRDLADLEVQQRDLRVEFRALGQDGLGERVSALEGEIESARGRLHGLEREAAASRLLHETLLATQRASKERWLGPVRSHVAPYLRLIHPDSEIRIDDRSLEIEGLVRDGVLEDFAALSMGAREQVAVVTRLALADILRGAGHPAVVILDDALVNTDDARLERMRNVLARAARGLQILIFTCRERDFLGLGATHRI